MAKKEEMEPLRVYFDDAESGWATPLPHGRARIENIPMAADLNLHDVVKLVPNPEAPHMPLIGRVLERKYPYKAALEYYRPEEYKELWHLFDSAGGAIEGMIEATPKSPGLALVAFDRDPIKYAEKYGYPQPPTYREYDTLIPKRE